ncbi:MAG: extracellular solute-binding protein [Saezia sp.]
MNKKRILQCLLSMLLLTMSPSLWAAHGYSLWGELKYPAGFAHFDYVNPNAPQGGELVLVSNLRLSTFDKYNPYSLKGSAPAYMSNLVFETLLVGSLDEADGAYGLLAEDVVVAPDKTWVRFRLNPQARFHNGDAVLAKDVIHSYNMLISEHASPAYRKIYAAISGVRIGEDERTVYFDLKEYEPQIPIDIGGLPVFSHKWGEGKSFGDITLEIPIASGPYKIGSVDYGRDITYVRDPNYWGNDLNVQRGQYNFDRITVRIYKDETAKLEAFKAGEFDFMQEFSAGNWARQYGGKRFDSGDIEKKLFEHSMPSGFQGYILNTRKPHYADERVRQALNLAYDFEWMNRALFYGSYARLHSYFENTEYQAKGEPTADELRLLQELQKKFGEELVPDALLNAPVPQQPTTEPPHSLRENLKQARDLLAQAGWTYRDGALRNAQGEPFVMVHLDSKESSSGIHAAWVRALEKLGIRFESRTVDFSLYQDLLDNYDFDVVTIAMRGSHVLGNELGYLYGSEAADTPHNANWWGIKNPVVDALIEKIAGASDKADAIAAGRVLDRILLSGNYSILQFTSHHYRVAYDRRKLAVPQVVPPYYQVENWVMSTWWPRGDFDK